MDDRALLERAAMAAGVPLKRLACGGPSGQVWLEDRQLWVRGWNPLTDSGDALELAVKLHMNIDLSERGRVVCRQGEWTRAIEAYGDDMLAATRRCITRAAAAVGEDQ